MKDVLKKTGNILTNILVTGILIALLIQLALEVVTVSVTVQGVSMEPTLNGGQVGRSLNIGLDSIERGDIVVVAMAPDEHVIKRVIGLPGDTVQYTLNTVYVNGEALEENYIKQEVMEEGIRLDNVGPYVLEADEYFILGDNRANSLDSRGYGPIVHEQLLSRHFIEARSSIGYLKQVWNLRD